MLGELIAVPWMTAGIPVLLMVPVVCGLASLSILFSAVCNDRFLALMRISKANDSETIFDDANVYLCYRIDD